MPTSEQIETWTAHAADALADKIGPHACVIVMAMEVAGAAPWAIEYRGGPVFVVFLEKAGAKEIDRKILPTGTR